MPPAFGATPMEWVVGVATGGGPLGYSLLMARVGAWLTQVLRFEKTLTYFLPQDVAPMEFGCSVQRLVDSAEFRETDAGERAL